MAKKKGGAGRAAKAGGAAAGGSAEVPPREFNEGDLVLAKVKGWPAWPAQIGKLETQGKHAGKYYVTYFGPGQQIGWCLPVELSEFDADQREASIQKSLKKTADKKFISAVKEICALQDERVGDTPKDSAEENGELVEDDSTRDSGLDGREEGTVEKEVKQEVFSMPVVTLNQQDESVYFNEGNPEEDADDGDGEKNWSERPEYNGSGLQMGKDSDGGGQEQEASHDGAVGEGLKSFAEVEKPDSEANGGRRRAFGNALMRINQTSDKDVEEKVEIPENDTQVLTYQYGRKKNRNKTNMDESPGVVNGAASNPGQEIVEDSAAVHAVTSEFSKKIKPKVGRPSKASQQSKMGQDSKSTTQAVRKLSAAEKRSELGKGSGGGGRDGGGKPGKDDDSALKRVSSDNGHNRKESDSKKKDVYSSSVKGEVLGGEKRERKLEGKKDVKGLASEVDRLKKGPKKSQILTKSSEESKKHSGTPKQRGEHVKGSVDDLEKKVPTSSPGSFGGSKVKSEVVGEASLKRRRLSDGEVEGEEGSAGGEKGDDGVSPKVDAVEKSLPLLKRPKMLASEGKSWEGKQKHVSVGRSGVDGNNAENDSPRDGKSRERGTSLPPKADKDRMRKAALDGEAALPPSKRRHRAYAAMSACEAEAATASAAESREQIGNGVSSNQDGNDVTAAASLETLSKEGIPVCGPPIGSVASPFKNATVTPDIFESTDGGHKQQKVGSGHDNAGAQDRIESKKHMLLKDAQATDSPRKHSSSEDPSKVQTAKSEGRAKSSKSKSPGPTRSSLEVATEKRKGHLSGSESGKLSTSMLGGAEAFGSLAKPSFEDSSIRNAVALANEKRNALKREGDASASMKVLIAVAQAKQRARQNSTGGSGSFAFAELDKFTNSMVCSPSPSQRRGSSGLTSPVQHGQGGVLTPHDGHKRQDLDYIRHGETAVDTEATIARDTFVGMLETVSRTKDSIGRTTRQAMDCAKHGIADQIVEVIVRKLENEPSFHRRVDYWFLLDSVTQVAHTQKVAAYLPIVQSFLPRILNAAAPPGGAARENRKQCLKVLNLWLERKVMPESVLRHFMTEIESHSEDKGLPGNGPRRLSRSERAVDDPVRDMDGMLVDEYGSNASLNLPDGFSIIPQLYEEEEEDSEDGDKKLETEFLSAINTTRSTEGEALVERHPTVLEDVDGELEMEDVSPTADSEVPAMKSREQLLADRFAGDARTNSGQPPLPLDPPPSVPSPPPLPADPPPSPPPPPRSPPPPLISSQAAYPSNGQSSAHSQDLSTHQASDSPSTPTTHSGLAGHQGQGNSGFSQVGSRTNSYPSGPGSQSGASLDSPIPPLPPQHCSSGFALGTRLPPPPPLPPSCRPQRVWPESFASPAGGSDVSPRLGRPGEEQVRQGNQEVSVSERAGDLSGGQQDAGPSQSGGCTSSGPSEGVQAGDQASGGSMSGYSSNAPLYLSQDNLYRSNAGGRPGPGAQFPYGPPGIQSAMRGRSVGGHFSPYAQYQTPPMNPPGTL
uniref:PWWP domain-containing protein n=1 Tax=Physcomitrium patens TaxID=3218 RepID=A0A7I4A4D8_PHYPA